MTNSPNGLEMAQAHCKVLERLAQKFDKESEEGRAIHAAAQALLSEAVRSVQREYDEFIAVPERAKHVEQQRRLWLANNPDAKAGTTAYIAAKLLVVAINEQGERELVPISWDDIEHNTRWEE